MSDTTRGRSTVPLVAAALIALLATTGVSTVASAAPADEPAGDVAGSLPEVASGARPGPDVLYAAAPDAPQLENRHPRFRAAPLLVSGTEAYIDGEYLYQDHLYDDYGSDTDGQGGSSLSSNTGDVTYPTDRERYAGNAADLVEFRASVGPDDVLYRVTLNTLLAADSTIVAVAFDTDGDEATGSDELPGDPNADFPGTDEAVVTWGTGAEHHDLDDPSPTTTAVDVDADLEANQITVTVPRSVSDPRGTWRTTVVVGLHDGEGGWLLPGQDASEDQPGGAGPLDTSPTGIFNVGFRFEEPYLASNVPPDADQAVALRDKAPTTFAHDIDFAALDAGEERTTVPETGTQVRLFPSRLDLGEGRDLETFPAYLGQLQPYSLYVPTGYEPDTPAGFTFDLHSLGQEHWQYNGSTGIQQLGEQRGQLVATPLARGPDGWYQHEAEYDTFEVWNDLARHFNLAPDRAAIAGYSMGGYGTYRLGGLYPDLFGKAFTTVGPPGDGIWIPPDDPTGGAETLSNLWLENVRNVPVPEPRRRGGRAGPAPGSAGAEPGRARARDQRIRAARLPVPVPRLPGGRALHDRGPRLRRGSGRRLPRERAGRPRSSPRHVLVPARHRRRRPRSRPRPRLLGVGGPSRGRLRGAGRGDRRRVQPRPRPRRPGVQPDAGRRRRSDPVHRGRPRVG